MKRLIASTLLLLLISPLANAHHNKGSYKQSYYKARVLDVVPVYEYVTVNYGRDKCRSPHHSGYYSSSDYSRYSTKNRNHHATVLGSVIGGSIGHAASDRKHKIVGTVAGAIIGGVIAHNINHKISRKHDSYSSRHNQHHNSCVKHNRTPSKQRRLRGYEVTYKMKGRIYQTFSQDRPNKTIRIYR